MTDENVLKMYEKYQKFAETMLMNKNSLLKINVVALFFHKKIMVSMGQNLKKSHTLSKVLNYHTINEQYYTIHAELDGYIRCKNLGTSFDKIFIYRGIHANLPSKPCKYCYSWLKSCVGVIIVYLNRDKLITIERMGG